MRPYCQRVEQTAGDSHRTEIEFMAKWYIEQFNNFNTILQAQMIDQLNQLAFDCTIDYNQVNYKFSFDAVLSPFCIADFLCKHILSTFSYGPEIVGNMVNFKPNELNQSWFDYHGDAVFVAEILQEYFNQNSLGQDINLNVILEERTIRSNFTHQGNLELCMSLIRFYNVLRKMLIFMNKDYEAQLPEFEYPSSISCDVQVLSGHFDFDNFSNRTTVLIAGSLHDIPQNQLTLIANMPWNIIIDFDGSTVKGGLKGAVRDKVVNQQLLTTSVAQNITISQGITNWLLCGEFLTPTPSQDLQNLFAPKAAFYTGSYHRYYRNVHKLLTPIFKTMENEQNPISILFLHYDDELLKQVIDLCEEHLDVVSYSLSAVYYWSKEKRTNIENDKYFTYIHKEEDYYDKFKIFPCDLQSFFKGLETYNILPALSNFSLNGKKLPTSEGLKDVPVNLITRLEKYFDVLYSNCGNEEAKVAEQLIHDFHRGTRAPWCAFSNGEVVNTIGDTEYENWIQRIRTTLGKLAEVNTRKVFNLMHKPGIGGSTMLRHIGWTLHKDYPVLIANKYERLKIKNLLEDLYDQHSSKGILVLVDEEYDNLEDLERDIKELSRPCAIIVSKRIFNNSFSKQDLTYTMITGDAEKRLRHIFRGISSLDKRTLEEKDASYYQFISQDLSMKSPFFIGLYYIERDFKYLNDYVKQATANIYNEKELKALGLICLCDIYGPAHLPAVLVNKYLGISIRSNYLLNNSNVNSVLYYGKTGGGTVCYISKHMLISSELLEQCSLILFNDSYKNTLHKWADALIDLLFSACKEKFNEIYKTILEKVFIRNRITTEQSESDFSKLIIDISIPELRKELLAKLAVNSGSLADGTDPEEEPAVYMMAAHFYGHLSRIYSKSATEFINYELAVQYSQKSMYYLEECSGQDSIIYHMHGDSLRLLFKENCNEILKSDAKLSNEAFSDLENKIIEIRHYYNIAAQIGGFIYAATSTIRLLIDYLKFIYRYKNISCSDDFSRLSSGQQLVRLDVEELIHALDMEELDEYNKAIYNNLLNEYQSGIMFDDYSNAIQYFQNRMDYLIAHQGSIKEIASVRQSLINARLAKYRKNASNHVMYYAEIPSREVEEILELLEKSFEQSIDINDFSERHSRCSAYNKWMNLAKFSRRDISKGILYAKQWKALTEKEHRYDPNPYYYLYVLYYLSVLDGNKEDEKNIEVYRKQSYTYANNRGNRVDYIRDILIAGTGMGRLCDASVIEDWGKLTLRKDIRLMPLEGRFDMVESKKGIVLLKSPVKWINRKAKFQTRENNSLSDEQRTHTVCFYGGFSYEMITAINSSVRDITSGEILPVPVVNQQEKTSAAAKVVRTDSVASVLAMVSQKPPFVTDPTAKSSAKSGEKRNLPDFNQMISFQIKQVREDRVLGTIVIEGNTYDGQITSGLTPKKVKGLKGKKTVQAKVISHNELFYILRL